MAEGAATVFDLMGCLGAGTGCGSCQVDLRRALEGAREAHQRAAQAGCSSTSRTMPIRSSVGTSLNTLK
ncbi:hypothetical protein D3C83_89940 [compost metagenome]